MIVIELKEMFDKMRSCEGLAKKMDEAVVNKTIDNYDNLYIDYHIDIKNKKELNECRKKVYETFKNKKKLKQKFAVFFCEMDPFKQNKDIYQCIEVINDIIVNTTYLNFEIKK